MAWATTPVPKTYFERNEARMGPEVEGMSTDTLMDYPTGREAANSIEPNRIHLSIKTPHIMLVIVLHLLSPHEIRKLLKKSTLKLRNQAGNTWKGK